MQIIIFTSEKAVENGKYIVITDFLRFDLRLILRVSWRGSVFTISSRSTMWCVHRVSADIFLSSYAYYIIITKSTVTISDMSLVIQY
jgi:hypothetical protein